MLPPFTFAALGFCGGTSASRKRVHSACTQSTKGGTFSACVLRRQNTSPHAPLGGRIRRCAPCGPKPPPAEARCMGSLCSPPRTNSHKTAPRFAIRPVQYGRRAAACNRSVRQAGCPACGVRNILRRLRSKNCGAGRELYPAKIVTFFGYSIKIPARTTPFSPANAPHGRPAAPTPRSTKRRAPAPPNPTGGPTAGFRE